MAVRKKGVIKAPAPAAAEGADDLQVLHPNLVAELNGRQVVVREYGFIEGLQLQAELQPFLDGLYEMAKGGTLVPLHEIVGLLGRHSALIGRAIAIAADVEPQEVLELKDQQQGHTLLMKWWIANGPFFWRCVRDRIVGEREVAKRLAGQTSTPGSSGADTVTSSPSAG